MFDCSVYLLAGLHYRLTAVVVCVGALVVDADADTRYCAAEIAPAQQYPEIDKPLISGHTNYYSILIVLTSYY